MGKKKHKKAKRLKKKILWVLTVTSLTIEIIRSIVEIFK